MIKEEDEVESETTLSGGGTADKRTLDLQGVRGHSMASMPSTHSLPVESRKSLRFQEGSLDDEAFNSSRKLNVTTVAVESPPGKKQKHESTTGKQRQSSCKKYFCHHCNNGLTSKQGVKQHLRIHTGEKPYTCKVCNKAFRERGALARHLLVHTGEKPYPCQVCDKAFRDRCALTHHLLVHTGEKPHSCQVCDKAFTERAALVPHSRLHTGVKPYSCEECGKTFTGGGNLARHRRRHTREKLHCCEEYGRRFSSRQSLLTHRCRQHTGEKLYSCEECGMTFTAGGNLARHRRRHTGEKPHSCQDCGLAFGQRANLVRHQSRFHVSDSKPGALKEQCTASAGCATGRSEMHVGQDGGKPQPCSDCNASFQDEFQLSHHRFQWHEDRLKLGCTRCRIWFGCGLQLRRHLETHTQGLRFQCGDCQQRFASRTLVSSHDCLHGQQQ